MLKSIAQTAGPPNLVEWTKLSLKGLKAPVMRVTRIRHGHWHVAPQNARNLHRSQLTL
jgi:hypothetical protein